MSEWTLQIQGLVKRFPKRGLFGQQLEKNAAVDGVDLQLRPGEVVGLIGESGSGKSTLVRCALGLVDYQEGTVEVLGHRLETLSSKDLRLERRNFQLLFQDPAAMLNPGMSVRRHLEESARIHGLDNPAQKAGELAARVGLSHRIDALPRELSGGEKRRVGLARVLAPNPRLLVADEPTAGLDAALKADLIDDIVSHRNARSSVLLISHDLAMVAYACDRVVVMLDGKIVERFRVDEIGTKQHHSYTQTLLRSAGLIDEAADPECAREKE